MVTVQGGGVVLILCVLAVCLMALVGPMVNAVSDITVAMPLEQEMVSTWDASIDQMMRAVVIDPAYSHAIEEHPDTAPIVHNCFDKKGQSAAFQIDPGKRFLRICILDDLSVAFQIVDIVGKIAKEKTAYIKDGLKGLNEAFKYAQRMNYTKFTKPIFQ